MYNRIFGYLRPHGWLFVGTMAATILFAALDTFGFTLIIPFLGVLFDGTGSVVEAASAVGGQLGGSLAWVLARLSTTSNPMDALRSVVVLLFVVFFLKNVALYLQQYSIALLQGRVTRDLRNHVYSKLLRLGFPFFQRTRTGQIITRLTSDVDQVRTLVTANLAKAVTSAAQVVFLIVLLLLISWKLTLIALLALPPMLGLWSRFRQRLRTGVLRVLDAVGDLASQLQETVSGIRLVKASNAEEWEDRRFQALTQGHYKAFIRNERWRQFFPPATEMVTALAILGLLWYGSYLVLEERSLEASAFILFLGAAMKLMAPAKFLGQFPALAQPGVAAAERVFEIVDTPAEVEDMAGALPVTGFRQEIRFEGVDFEYEAGSPVLRGLDLRIRPGEVVALVGPSGAGKSTLADLLPRFHEPTAGRVTLDGHDLRTLRLSDLRSLMGIVTQETILFHDTIAANIAYGRDDATSGEIEAAARAAHAHGFISEFPEGYDTIVGERGVRLSGGQRQRLAIARALFRNPPILILDEATSALDAESEHLVQQAIEELMHDRTVLVIAHRLSTIARADAILVLEEGRVVERGTHAELLGVRGVYQRLHQMQFREPVMR
ncbi:MAG: ABC transporter ATP-binding protein/permease [Gemmatimonadota bacterium]|nr:ABC transporter ATP-binding protein/permease [Gemmatimonadota bacterium]